MHPKNRTTFGLARTVEDLRRLVAECKFTIERIDSAPFRTSSGEEMVAYSAVATPPPLSAHPKVKSLLRKRFGRLKVIEFAGCPGKQAKWLCLCDCGGTEILSSSQLKHSYGGRWYTQCADCRPSLLD